jgi:hypothetical protein
VHLWCLDRSFVSLASEITRYTMASGIHDVKEIYYRTPQLLDGTDGAAADIISLALDEASTVHLAGVLATVSGAYSLAVETSDDGVVWVTRETVELTLTNGLHAWFQLSSPVEALHLRVRDTAAAGTLAGTLVAAAQWSDKELNRESRDRLALQYRPFQVGPTSYYVDRQASSTSILLDRSPTNPHDLLWVWARRNVQDVGQLSNDVDVPRHWLNATISKTAAILAFELPEELMPPQRLQLLTAVAEQDLAMVEDEEYDESSVEFDLNLAYYTR